MTHEITPVCGTERIAAMDVLRGFALLGIFLMNIEFFTRPLQDIDGEGIDSTLGGAAYLADALVFFFVQGKFWTLFSLLFGMGFAVMIERARRAQRPFAPVYLRRALALLGIGLLHALLVWSGDILVSYAIGALLLLLARQLRRKWQARKQKIPSSQVVPVSAGRLAGWGLALYLLIPVAVLVGGGIQAAMPHSAPSATQLQEKATEDGQRAIVRAAAERAYRDGDYAQAVGQRVVDTREQLGNLPLFMPMLLGILLLGAALVRSGLPAHPQDFLSQLRAVRNLGLPGGICLMAISVSMGTVADPPRFDLRYALQASTSLFAALVLALAYAAALTLALRGRARASLLRWLAPAGRMALSNYLLHSLLCTAIFYGYGLGQWGQVARGSQLLLALAIFLAQLLLSRWWLARFRFGPVEWLWRALTYLHWPPMRLVPESAP